MAHFSCPKPTLLPPTSAIFNNCFIFSNMFPSPIFHPHRGQHGSILHFLNKSSWKIRWHFRFSGSCPCRLMMHRATDSWKVFFSKQEWKQQTLQRQQCGCRRYIRVKRWLDLDDGGDRENQRSLRDQSLSFGKHFEDTSICTWDIFPDSHRSESVEKTRCHLYLWQWG